MLPKFKMKPQNSGHCRQMAAIRRWTLAQVDCTSKTQCRISMHKWDVKLGLTLHEKLCKFHLIDQAVIHVHPTYLRWS